MIYFFKIELAGKKIEVECFNKHVFYLCRDYLAKFDKPDFVVGASNEEIKKEVDGSIGIKEKLDENIAYEYVGAESMAVLRKIADVLIDSHILLIHGAAISVDGKCYIFTAESGTGKTTHIQNWLKVIPETIVVNGDKPFVDVAKKIVYGTPWSGKEGLNTNMASPLAGIIALERGISNSIGKVEFGEILPMLLQQTYIPSSVNPLLGYHLLDQLKDVPCYKLTCNMDEESAVVAYNGLCRNDG